MPGCQAGTEHGDHSGWLRTAECARQLNATEYALELAHGLAFLAHECVASVCCGSSLALPPASLARSPEPKPEPRHAAQIAEACGALAIALTVALAEASDDGHEPADVGAEPFAEWQPHQEFGGCAQPCEAAREQSP